MSELLILHTNIIFINLSISVLWYVYVFAILSVNVIWSIMNVNLQIPKYDFRLKKNIENIATRKVLYFTKFGFFEVYH